MDLRAPNPTEQRGARNLPATEHAWPRIPRPKNRGLHRDKAATNERAFDKPVEFDYAPNLPSRLDHMFFRFNNADRQKHGLPYRILQVGVALLLSNVHRHLKAAGAIHYEVQRNRPNIEHIEV